MNDDLARSVVRAAFQSMSELTNLLPLLKQHCDPQEYLVISRAVASATGHIGIDVLDAVFSLNPNLEQEVDAKIAQYGVFT